MASCRLATWPYHTAAYAGELEGDLFITRPDSTRETLHFVLPMP